MRKVVLDSSALLALLNAEPGGDIVAAAIAEGAAMTTVNLSEVVAKLRDIGIPDADTHTMIDALGIGFVEFATALAYMAGNLRPATRGASLSLGDRACLTLAAHLGVAALTAAPSWASLSLTIPITLIRA
ncbi:MAG: PIN domain-containing protein [Ktedonobacterales bacterium]|nr:PIN domain-containing protein [Ktedonobacterales bacterium]